MEIRMKKIGKILLKIYLTSLLSSVVILMLFKSTTLSYPIVTIATVNLIILGVALACLMIFILLRLIWDEIR